MCIRWRNGELEQEKRKQWKIVFMGFGAGILIMLGWNALSNKMEKKELQVLETKAPQLQEASQEQITNTVMEDRKEDSASVIASGIEISENFMEELLIYQYIEYGLRKYSEDNNQSDRYFCDIEEDLLPNDAVFSMKNDGEKPYKTDLAKEIIPELVNNIYNFRLTNPENTLYMSIDTYNMKIYIYDKFE